MMYKLSHEPKQVMDAKAPRKAQGSRVQARGKRVTAAPAFHLISCPYGHDHVTEDLPLYTTKGYLALV